MSESKDTRKIKPIEIAFYTGLVCTFIVAFFPVLRTLLTTWIHSDDNSHGLLIIPVSLYILWQNRSRLQNAVVSPGQAGKVLVTMAVLFYVLSYKAGIATLSNLFFVLTIWAIVWALFGNPLCQDSCRMN